MGREVTLFSSKEPKSRADIAAFLRNVADRMDGGQVVLRQGTDEVVLDMPGQMVLELKVEDEHKRRKGIQHSLEIEMKWYDGQSGPSGVELG